MLWKTSLFLLSKNPYTSLIYFISLSYLIPSFVIFNSILSNYYSISLSLTSILLIRVDKLSLMSLSWLINFAFKFETLLSISWKRRSDVYFNTSLLTFNLYSKSLDVFLICSSNWFKFDLNSKLFLSIPVYKELILFSNF